VSVLSRKTLENLYAVYFKATTEFRAIGKEDWAERLHEDFGHELTAWDSWYDDEQDPHQIPDYRPTMADLNHELKKHGYRGVGGKHPRVVKL
jgi:hypothetical protein